MHSIGLPHIWILICCKEIYILKIPPTGQNVGAQPEHYLLVQWPEYVGKESEKNNSEFICWSANMRKYNTTYVLGRMLSSPTLQSVNHYA